MSFAIQTEDLHTLHEDKLHDLVLVHHVERHVATVQFRPHQRRSEHDANALGRHKVFHRAFQDSTRNRKWMVAFEFVYRHMNRLHAMKRTLEFLVGVGVVGSFAMIIDGKLL